MVNQQDINYIVLYAKNTFKSFLHLVLIIVQTPAAPIAVRLKDIDFSG